MTDQDIENFWTRGSTLSRTLYIFAWIVEGFAVIIGLSISMILVFDSIIFSWSDSILASHSLVVIFFTYSLSLSLLHFLHSMIYKLPNVVILCVLCIFIFIFVLALASFSDCVFLFWLLFVCFLSSSQLF